jgi:HSP20 family protein
MSDEARGDEKATKPEELKVDFSVGGLFKGLERIIEGVAKLQDLAEKTGGKTTTGHFSIPGLQKDAKGVFGFSINTLKSGEVKVEPFGNVRKTAKGPEVEEQREPIVDLLEEGDSLQVLIEMPGVEESAVETELRGDILIVRGTGERNYAKELLLPFPVKENSVARSFKNGVLELKLERA